MIENKKLGLKIAESKEEKQVAQAMENTEEKISTLKFELELSEVIMQYLKKKAEKFRKENNAEVAS